MNTILELTENEIVELERAQEHLRNARSRLQNDDDLETALSAEIQTFVRRVSGIMVKSRR